NCPLSLFRGPARGAFSKNVDRPATRRKEKPTMHSKLFTLTLATASIIAFSSITFAQPAPGAGAAPGIGAAPATGPTTAPGRGRFGGRGGGRAPTPPATLP